MLPDLGILSLHDTFIWFRCGCFRSRHAMPLALVCPYHAEEFARSLGFDAILFIGGLPAAKAVAEGIVSQLAPVVERGLAVGFREIRRLIGRVVKERDHV